MEFLTGYYRQQEAESVALVLQHFVYRKGQRQAVFGCISVGKEEAGEKTLQRGEAYVAEQLLQRFQRQGRSLLEVEDGQVFERMEAWLRLSVAEMERELAAYAVCKNQDANAFPALAGVLCKGDKFWLFSYGECGVYVLNNRLGRNHCKKLLGQASSGPEILSGQMESGIGILLTTEAFDRHITTGQIEECLTVPDINTAQKAQKRLQELGTFAHRQGGKQAAAILIVTT